jgi:hypothetical protein
MHNFNENPDTNGSLVTSIKGLGDNFKLALRKKDKEDKMDGGWNWPKIVTIRSFDLSGFCSQRVLGWLICWSII